MRVNRSALPAASFETALPPVGALAVVLGSPLGFEKSGDRGHRVRSAPLDPGIGARVRRAGRHDADRCSHLSGDSGGAVVDGQGRVIGISEAYIPPEQGAVAIGFAISAATAVNIADQLLKTGRAEHAFIGIQPA